MGSCLGIYLGNKVIKYAKLIQDDKTKRISLDSYGTKYVSDNDNSVIQEIITQTGSTNVPLCFNVKDYHRHQTEVFKQLSKNDIRSVVALEVGEYASLNDLNEKTLNYRYIFMDSNGSNDNYTADIAITEKANIVKYQDDDNFKNLYGIYPKEYIIKNLVQNSSNYLILNIDEKTQLISVVGGKINRIIDVEISMGDILNRIAEQEGSYSKAIDMCRSINVLSDDENVSHEIEGIIEPIIQDLLNRIKTKLDESRVKYERMYLTGLVNLFINIDVLFEQFFGITTEKLKPYFLKSDEMSLNMAEVIETNDAISLALEGLEKANSKVNFLEQVDKQSAFSSLFSKKPSIKLGARLEKKKISINFNKEKVETGLMLANLTAATALVGYVSFSGVYSAQMDKISNQISKNINELKVTTSNVESDTKYIQTETNKYKSYNDYISDIIQKVKNGRIGKYTTYNVANFMQNIARYIPSNVELQSISSDDNKSVTIVARSTSYSELGYFISELKLRGILKNIKTGRVETGNVVTVTIGGDLP